MNTVLLRGFVVVCNKVPLGGRWSLMVFVGCAIVC
jgi:hypothetical protein